MFENNMLLKFYNFLNQVSTSPSINNYEIGEFDDKSVCDYWYCIDNSNVFYFILIVILFIVFAFLVYSLYKEFRTKK